MESIRVLHLTDPHLFADADGDLRGTVTQDSLQRVLDHYEAGDWRADRALITGDLIQDDSAAAYDRFRELLLPLNMRMHCVPGNHDIRNLMRPICSRPPFSYCAKEEIRDWLLLGLDSCIKGDAGGEVSAQELDRMRVIISESSAKHIMLCLHHPPVPMGSTWLDSVSLKNGDELLERLQASGRVRLLVFGHVHQPYEAEHHGIQVIGTPSTCSQFKPGSDEFELDERPPAYRRFTLHGDGSSESELIWVNE
jgi:Icc protein